MDQQGCLKGLLMGAIWLGSPFLFMIIMPLLSQTNGTIASFINFIIPDLSIIISAIAISGISIIKEIFGLIGAVFKRKKKEVPSQRNPQTVPKSFGSSAIPMTAFIFLLGGSLVSLFAGDVPMTQVMGIYTVAGMVWGFLVYLLFQNGIFDVDEF